MFALIAVLLFTALLAYFAHGDSSGLKMMAPIIFIIYAIYIFGIIIDLTMDNYMVIIIIFLVSIIALAVCNRIHEELEYKKEIERRKQINSIQRKKDLLSNGLRNISTPNTEFKNELNTITRSKDEVNNELLKKKQIEIEKQVKIDYVDLKDKIKKCAENGQYIFDKDNNLKIITVDVYSDQLQKFKSGRDRQYITTAGGLKKQCVTYFINDIQMYNYYLEMLRNLTDNDGIMINVILKNTGNGMVYTKIPCIVCDTIVYPQNYSLYLRCSIEY